MKTFLEYKESEKFKKQLSKTKGHYDIDDLSEFSEDAITALINSCKKGDTGNVIRESKIVLFQNTSLMRISNSTLTNVRVFCSPLRIKNCTITDNEIVHCHLFQSENTNLTECHFHGGMVDIEQSNPLIFNFENGSILNPKKNFISFFGLVESFDYFLKNLDNYPFCDYQEELNCILLMGVK